MDDKDIKQFMLTSGDQIVSEVISWPVEDQTEIVCRNIMQIQIAMDPTTYQGKAMVRPWMTQQCHPQNITTLQIDHIVGMAIPTSNVITSYKTACDFYSEEGEEIPEEDGFEEDESIEEEATYEDVLAYYMDPDKKIH